MVAKEQNLQNLRINYYRALRCWKSNNLKSCLSLCDDLTVRLNEVSSSEKQSIEQSSPELVQLKQLVWYLKIKCLADDYYVNEPLLLNEDDVDEEDKVQVLSGSRRSRSGTTARGSSSAKRSNNESGTRTRTAIGTGTTIEARPKTGILTGRLQSASRQASRATSSYRPLTTSLTASQTAFSRSTRPLLKYSTHDLLSKPVYEYLYNTQTVTSKCPDYRQCLEYLNLVRKSQRVKGELQVDEKRDDNKTLITIDELSDDLKSLGVYWLTSFGICYYNLHMNKQAEEFFANGIVLNPKYLDCYTWLVKIYLRTNQPMQVLKTCHDGLNHSKSPMLYNWMARAQSLIGDLYAANNSLRKSLVHYPTNIEALSNVGYFAFYGDRLEQSLKCFEHIQQLTINQATFFEDEPTSSGSSSQLLNNLAICYFYSGLYHKVVPLFFKALLNSPSKEVTSDIWYNLSFVPLNCGFKNLAIACLRLALKNDSRNDEATNNLGVLKYVSLINESKHFENRQETWNQPQTRGIHSSELELKNLDSQNRLRSLYDDAESYFNPPRSEPVEEDEELDSIVQPEMLYNMALIKKKRGNLIGSVKFCNLYLENDPNNYTIMNLLNEIQDLVSHDS